jgi:glycerate dehydrogenase
MKIVFLDSHCLNPGDMDYSPLKAIGELVIYDRTSPQQIVERAKDAEVILTNKVSLRADVLRQLPNLKQICVTATGYNIIDIQTAQELGIVVNNVPNYAANTVAQHVFAMMLEWTHHTSEQLKDVNDGGWEKSVDWSLLRRPYYELAGKTLGLVGFGAIGSKVAEIASAFGMRVVYIKKSLASRSKFAEKLVSLDYLLPICDFVSLHCPLTPETSLMVNDSFIAKMKPSAVLINTARGGLIDEAILADALNNGKLAGALLDVLTEEPANPNCPLLKAHNCLITAHTAWASIEARTEVIRVTAENIKSLFVFDRPRNWVNKPESIVESVKKETLKRGRKPKNR